MSDFIEPHEKEKIFADALHGLIDRFCQEYNMTYAQVIGLLAIVQSELIHDGFEDEEDEDDGQVFDTR